MNLQDEGFQLIDIYSADDFLIDSQLSDTFVDLRLSVALEIQNELANSAKAKCCTERKNMKLNLSDKEQNAFGPVQKSGEDLCNARKSLAWDRAFFTSPGFLELEELCLINSGFKNLEITSSHEIEGNLRSKVFQDRDTRYKAGVGARCRQKNQPLMKTKVASPYKHMSIQSSRRQYMNIGRSENTNSRKELSKPTKHVKKPSLPAISTSRSGHGVVTSKQPVLSSYGSNTFIDFPPCTTSLSVGFEQTGRLLKSHRTEGDMKEANQEDLHSLSYDTYNASQAFNSEGHQNHQRNHTCITQSLERYTLEKNITKETKNSLISSTNFSLCLPSQKIGFSDVKLETGKHDQDDVTRSIKGKRRRNSHPSTKKPTQSLKFEQQENMFHPKDTVIDFQPMKSSPSPSKLVAVGCSPSSDRYSSPSKLVAVGSSPSSGQYSSSSSEKSLTKTERPKRQTMLSRTRSRTQSFTKITP